MLQTPRKRRRKGAELLEFTLCLLPLLVILLFLLDVAWAAFVQSTLQYAVHAGVRYGITVTGTQAKGSDLTTMVKQVVQANSLGILKASDTTTDASARIKVFFLQPPDPGSTANPTDVTSNTVSGNYPGNIMQVAIQGFALRPLIPRIFGWKKAVDNASSVIGAVAADLIEPSDDLPTIAGKP
jgi:Flp pilus assembly protein TadG